MLEEAPKGRGIGVDSHGSRASRHVLAEEQASYVMSLRGCSAKRTASWSPLTHEQSVRRRSRLDYFLQKWRLWERNKHRNKPTTRT